MLGISRATFYRRRNQALHARKQRRKPRASWYGFLKETTDKNPVYGYRKIWVVSHEVHSLSPSSVYRSLKEQNLLLIPDKTLKRARRKSDSSLPRPKGINQVWMVDITEVDIDNYGRYRTITVFDCYARKVISYLFSHRISAEEVVWVCEEALKRAKEIHGPITDKIILITDNGSQFTSFKFERYLKQTPFVHIRTIYRSPNGIAGLERFHKSLKYEEIYRNHYANPIEALKNIEIYINWYNKTRIHQALGYLTPDKVYAEQIKLPENPESVSKKEVKTVSLS